MLETAEDIRQYMASQLDPLFKGLAFVVYRQSILGNDSVNIDFFQVPKGAPDIDHWNSPVYIKVVLDGVRLPTTPKGEPAWKKNDPTPGALKAWEARSHGGVRFRAKTGAPKAVVDYIVKWFKTNADKLKAPPAPRTAMRSMIAAAYLSKG